MSNSTIREDEWEKMYLFLKNHPRAYAGKEADCRLFLEAVHWILRSGAQWRFLPEKYGNWNSIYKRYARWCDHDIFEDMHQHFIEDPDMENLLLDSTIVRAHPCAAGAPQKKAGRPSKHSDAAGVDSAPKSMPT
jgi:transposase